MKKSHQAVSKPEADHPSFHEHQDHIFSQYSQPQGKDTTWEEESSLYGVIDGYFEDSNHDDKDWFPCNLTEYDLQGLETQFQGDKEETGQRIDTTRELAHCQSSHVPPGHVDASPVHCDALQAPDLRKPGTVIPCPLRLRNGCSGKDENMASLE